MSEYNFIGTYERHEFKDGSLDGSVQGTSLNSALFTQMEDGISNAFESLNNLNDRWGTLNEAISNLETKINNVANTIVGIESITVTKVE